MKTWHYISFFVCVFFRERDLGALGGNRRLVRLP